MCSFTVCDEAIRKNKFLRDPIDKVDGEIGKKQDEDRVGNSGISLVIGCPLPPEIQEKILDIQRKFDQALLNYRTPARVKWREDLAALHITVYGLIKPSDYKRGQHWPVAPAILGGVRDSVSGHLPFKLTLQGLGILGAGAVAVRISDSSELDLMRDGIENLPGVSKRGYSERLPQMIIGRFLPRLKEVDRRIIQCALDDLKNFPIGGITVNSLELVHYKHEFLNHLYGQEVFPQIERDDH